jgi:hypothetical protein
MSTKNTLSLSKRNDSMLLTVALLLGLVAGIVVWQLTSGAWYVVLWMIILVLGIYFLASMPFASNRSDYIPSQQSFRLVWGALLTTLGALLLFRAYGDLQFWILAVIMIAVVAVVVLVLFLKGPEKDQ